MIGCTQALAFLAVFVYATHTTQAIAFEWKLGLTQVHLEGRLLNRRVCVSSSSWAWLPVPLTWWLGRHRLLVDLPCRWECGEWCRAHHCVQTNWSRGSVTRGPSACGGWSMVLQSRSGRPGDISDNVQSDCTRQKLHRQQAAFYIPANNSATTTISIMQAIH